MVNNEVNILSDILLIGPHKVCNTSMYTALDHHLVSKLGIHYSKNVHYMLLMPFIA